MTNVDLSDFKNLYFKTASDYIKKMDRDIKAMEQDLANKEAAEDMHLSSHSLKSQSLLMGYQSTGELAHAIEEVFKKIKENTMTITPEIIQAVSDGVSSLQKSLYALKREDSEPDVTSDIMKLNEYAET